MSGPKIQPMNLCEVIRQYRWAEKLSVRDCAFNIGIGYNTLHRLEHGKEISSAHLAQVIRWMLFSTGGRRPCQDQ